MHRRHYVMAVAVLAASIAGVVAPTTEARASSMSAAASLTGLDPGSYRLTVTIRSTSGSTVPGALVQQVAGEAQLLRVATFSAGPIDTVVTAGVRVTDPADLFTVLTVGSSQASGITAAPAALGPVVRGTRLIGSDGAPMTWHGINSDPWMSSGDIVGLHDTTRANLVRIPVSECFWLPWSSSYQPTYRDHVADLVNSVTSSGMTAIVDLHWACHDDPLWQQRDYNTQNQVASDQHSIDFWRDAAATFSSNRSVMFELFNEPQMMLSSNYGGRSGADVWLSGGQVSYGLTSWSTPGMQALYDAVRSTGAENVVLVDGMEWSSDLRMLTIGYGVKGSNLAYAYHAYTHDGQDAGAHSPYLDTMVWPSIDPAGRWAFAAIATEFGTAARNVPLMPTATNYFNDTLWWFATHEQSWAVWGWYPASYDAYGLLQARPSTVTKRGEPVLWNF